jgi:hypothetical protein
MVEVEDRHVYLQFEAVNARVLAVSLTDALETQLQHTANRI